MIITSLAIAVMIGSAALLLKTLPLMAQDSLQVVRNAAMNARRSGQLVPNIAFGSLWLLIFALCYF